MDTKSEENKIHGEVYFPSNAYWDSEAYEPTPDDLAEFDAMREGEACQK